MFLLVCLAALVLGFTSGAEDFDVTAFGFEFVYHDSHDLLLVMHDNKCYFGQLSDNRESTEERMMDSDVYKRVIEGYLMHVLRDGHVAEHSNLNTMRDEFSDLLANFRCDGKDIYTFEMEARFVDLHIPRAPDEICLRSRGSSSDDWSEWKTALNADCQEHIDIHWPHFGH